MVAAQFKKRTTMSEFTLALIPVEYIREAKEGGATTVRLAEMANRNADLVKRYFYFVAESNQWKKVDLNSQEEFKQKIEGLKGNNNNRAMLAKLVEEQCRILTALINQSYINQLWESLKFGDGLTTVKNDIEQLKGVITELKNATERQTAQFEEVLATQPNLTELDVTNQPVNQTVNQTQQQGNVTAVDQTNSGSQLGNRSIQVNPPARTALGTAFPQGNNLSYLEGIPRFEASNTKIFFYARECFFVKLAIFKRVEYFYHALA